MNKHLFSYGTLQKDKVTLEAFGRLLKGWTDTLKGLSSLNSIDYGYTLSCQYILSYGQFLVM